MVFFGDHLTCQRRYLSLELHRQCVFPALAVVGGVDGVNVPPPARKLGGVIPADTVELHGMDAAQRTDKPLCAVLPMIQLHKVHHAPQDSRPEGVRSALPRRHDVPQSFAVDLFAQLVVQLQRRAHAADAVVAQLHTVVVEGKPRPVSGCDKRLGRRIAAHHLGAQLDARRQGCGVTVLLGKEQGFLPERWTERRENRSPAGSGSAGYTFLQSCLSMWPRSAWASKNSPHRSGERLPDDSRFALNQWRCRNG